MSGGGLFAVGYALTFIYLEVRTVLGELIEADSTGSFLKRPITDWLFPETIREYAFRGVEVMIRISAYMDPWGATAPMDWWNLVNRTRALENMMYVVAANQGASMAHYPPFSWPGGSMVVDYDGRVLAQADPGPGEKVVVAPISPSTLRAERDRRVGHHTVAHTRTGLYTYLDQEKLRPATQKISVETLNDRVSQAKPEPSD